MGILATLAGYAVPVCLIASPVLSYVDQGIAMYRSRSSAGFSLDIPLIMLVSSICKIFYYPGARYETALLIQAFANILTQTVLLKIALEYRPSPSSKGGEAATPFAGVTSSYDGGRRPYNFWQWRSTAPYWKTLVYLFVGLAVLELVVAAPLFPPALYGAYSDLIGYAGLGIEATLPLPQLAANARSRSCRGFRVSLLASWLLGDAMKMAWFFGSAAEIPWSFKMCGLFQAACDVGLGVQYAVYGDGGGADVGILGEKSVGGGPGFRHHGGGSGSTGSNSGHLQPWQASSPERRSPFTEKRM